MKCRVQEVQNYVKVYLEKITDCDSNLFRNYHSRLFFIIVSSGKSIGDADGDPMATQADMEALKAQLGLDQPVIVQYLKWLQSLLQGNMGISYRTNLPVMGMVLERLGPTLILTLTSTALSVLIAVPLGIMSAYKPYSAWDYISSGLAFVGASTPTFFTGLVIIYVFAVKLQSPSYGRYV